MSDPWFRFYPEVYTDRKISRAAAAAGTEKLFFIGAWAGLLSFASSSPDRGRLLITTKLPYTDKDICEELELEPEKWSAIRDALFQYEMLDQDENGVYFIRNWDKRQFKSDNSTERVRKYRKKQDSNDDETGDETGLKRFGNAPDTETESETESEIDGADAPPPTPSQKEMNAIRKELEVHFLTKTNLPAPNTRTEAARKEAGKLWYTPLREIAELSGWNCDVGRSLIDEALLELKGLTISDPKSILKTVRSIYAKRKQGSGVDSTVAKLLNEGYTYVT